MPNTTKRILMRTSRTNEHGDGCEFAVVILDADLAKVALARRGLFRAAHAADKNVLEMRFYDLRAHYYADHDHRLLYDDPPVIDEDSLPQEAARDLFDGGLVELPEDFTLPESEERTECDRMIIHEHGVAWTCVPKHADFDVTTEEIPWEMLERLL